MTSNVKVFPVIKDYGFPMNYMPKANRRVSDRISEMNDYYKPVEIHGVIEY